MQRHALDVVLKAIAPTTLSLPDRITKLIPPHPAGYSTTRESFAGRTGLTFDPLGAAEASAEETLSVLLDPERAARLVQFHGFNRQQLGLGEVLDRLITQTWKTDEKTSSMATVQRTIADVLLQQMIVLASNEKAAPEVRAITALKLHELSQWASKPALSTDEDIRAHLLAAVSQVRDFEQHPGRAVKPTEPLAPPPGQPIGSAEEDDFVLPRLR
jgi:Met-zincin